MFKRNLLIVILINIEDYQVICMFFLVLGQYKEVDILQLTHL